MIKPERKKQFSKESMPAKKKRDDPEKNRKTLPKRKGKTPNCSGPQE